MTTRPGDAATTYRADSATAAAPPAWVLCGSLTVAKLTVERHGSTDRTLFPLTACAAFGSIDA
jgi:hypothetical protein